jgi:hypothetical protein
MTVRIPIHGSGEEHSPLLVMSDDMAEQVDDALAAISDLASISGEKNCGCADCLLREAACVGAYLALRAAEQGKAHLSN